jgi:pimeloyl-ACP methyl ester carboxylesterase
MINKTLKKSLVALTTATLVAALAVAVPTAARADGLTCSEVAAAVKYSARNTQLCSGVDQFGAQFEIAMPKKFNGTLIVWSHGIRKNTNLPRIPVVAPTGYVVDNSPEIAPAPAIATALLKQGFALAGSGVQAQGWNQEEQVLATTIVIDQAITKFPQIDRIAAWGASLGGLSTQLLAESNPGLVDAVAPLCLSDSVEANAITYASDALWLTKTLFDPSIKGTGYASGTTGYTEMVTDIGKVLTVFGTLSASIQRNPIAPTWPETSTAPATLKGIPVRSAVLLMGLLAGVPTQSRSFDSSSGPKGPLETSFGLVISPALAVLENAAEAAILAVVATYDLELRAGGVVYDNTKTNWATRLGDDSDVYAAGLTGKSAIAGMLSYLSPLNPAAPRVKADPSAAARVASWAKIQGNVTVPTITLAGTADHIAQGTQYFIDQYKAAVAGGNAKSGLLVNIWNKPPDEYTKFTDAGTPISVDASAATNGTQHCNFTGSQWLTIAKLLTDSAKSGKAPSSKVVKAAIAKDKNLFTDPNYRGQVHKYRQ